VEARCSPDVVGWAAGCAAARDATTENAATAASTTATRRPVCDGFHVAHPLLNRLVKAPAGLARRRKRMLETIAIILIILWLLGMVSGYTLGNFIYVLLVIAIVLFLVRLISGRRV
jgi:hypothetical protein